MKSFTNSGLRFSKGTGLGDFEVLSALGSGGMGEVYRARDRRLERDVAIKVLPRLPSFDPERLHRFEQEAKAAAALNHPNILVVFQMGTYEDVSYLVSELLEGDTLREQVKHGPIALKKAIDYGVQIAHGLAAAHERGIVHRDLKPENLFVTKDARIKILDFGLAKLTHAEGETQLTEQILDTEPGAVLGTAGYMSPEQVRGQAADHRADIFALGAILYETLTGRRAFCKSTTAETMSAILNEEPTPISQIMPSVPPGLQRAMQRCLEKDPEQRFQSATDLAFALEVSSESGSVSTSGNASIAVLPFTNMSTDSENEFFAEGITEEIINALTQIDELHVAARTSAFSFKGKSVDLRIVGERLNVKTVLEGSVRKAGSRVRITAQLINVADGYHLWSERYDRELKDIFEVQDDVAFSIVERLKITLGDRLQPS